MNTAQAKRNIGIVDYLQSNGFQPVRQNGSYFWYLSPLRNEKTASFSVNIDRNTYVDWGTGDRGTIIDLVMELCQTSVSGALKKLNEFSANSPGFISNKHHVEFFPEKTIPGKISKVFHFKTRLYLNNRAIPEFIWRNCEFLFEYTYKNPKPNQKSFPTGHQYYNLAWKNDKGGYELRNNNFKSCLLHKDITTIPGDTSEFNLFEGFFDYLSALVYYQRKRLPGTSIVLNSVVLLDHILPTLKNANNINVYLDNDSAGEKAFSTIAGNYKRVVNQSKKIYPEFNDFNDFLVETKRKH